MPDGRLLASHGADGTHFYVTDHQKSVVAIIGADGQRAGTYRYAPYGEPTAASQDNPFRWHGGYYDDEGDGCYHFGARYYDADSHFTQPDPVTGNLDDPLTLNGYAYSAGNPVNNSHPSGRFFEEVWDSASFWLSDSTSCFEGGAFAVLGVPASLEVAHDGALTVSAGAAMYSSGFIGTVGLVGISALGVGIIAGGLFAAGAAAYVVSNSC